MSSWLSKRLGIHVNLRPLARPLGAIAGSMLLPGVGTALGAGLGAGAAGAADDLGHGKNIGQAVKGGLKTGAMTYAGAKFLPMLGRAMGGGGEAAAATAPMENAAADGYDYGGFGQGAGAGAGGGAGASAPAATEGYDFGGFGQGGGGAGGGGASSSLPAPAGNLAQRALRSVGGFVKKNPTASLNAAGTTLSAYTQNAQANKQFGLERDQVMRANAIEDADRKRRQAVGSAWLQAMAKQGNPMALQLAQQLGYA